MQPPPITAWLMTLTVLSPSHATKPSSTALQLMVDEVERPSMQLFDRALPTDPPPLCYAPDHWRSRRCQPLMPYPPQSWMDSCFGPQPSLLTTLGFGRARPYAKWFYCPMDFLCEDWVDNDGAQHIRCVNPFEEMVALAKERINKALSAHLSAFQMSRHDVGAPAASDLPATFVWTVEAKQDFDLASVYAVATGEPSLHLNAAQKQ